MKFKSMMAAAAALTMTASPVLAAANPAASLSVAPARVGTPTAKNNRLAGFGGAGLFAILIVVGIAAIVIVDATKDDSPSSR